MTENPRDDVFEDVLEPTEQATPDHHEHAKMPKHPNDDELARRTEQERIAAGVDDYDPEDIPSATE